MLDQTLIADAQDQKQRPISVAWIDYTKAFDSVPHSYLKWLLRAVQVPKPMRELIKSLISDWRVRYEIRDPIRGICRSNPLKIRSGVLQGDSFSPLLFCIAMAPISHAIKAMGKGYSTGSGKLENKQLCLTHLFYMDDLKLYTSSKEDLEAVLRKVTAISAAIHMHLNTKKCSVAHFIPKRLRVEREDRRGTASDSEDLSIPVLEGKDLYKYLGIEQSIGMHESEAWSRVEGKCYNTAKKVWESDLTFRQKVSAFNTMVIPALSYVVTSTVRVEENTLVCLSADKGWIRPAADY